MLFWGQVALNEMLIFLRCVQGKYELRGKRRGDIIREF